MKHHDYWDVILIGAGLAGLTLARQLLISTHKRILHLERRTQIPPDRQKVGESTVQIGAYYFGKILDLEEYFHQEQLMKYNLRFFWPSAEDPFQYESYSQSYIRHYSNIPCYQLNRNRFEQDLIAMNTASERYLLKTGCSDITVQLNSESSHQIHYLHLDKTQTVHCDWVVDASGRNRYLAGNLNIKRPSELRHAASFFWVDGIVNVEKLTDIPHHQRLRHPVRQNLGHLPVWLATNHLMGEGFWFWIIPLKYHTSFGLVFDQDCVNIQEVNSKEKLLNWLFDRFPLLHRTLEDRDIIDFTCMRNYSHGCERTIHPQRWAMTGESGRFSDPLYSPGSDLIALHNTLICDAICTENDDELSTKTMLFEPMMNSLYQSFLPSFNEGYPALGDQECFCMKYGWELSIYFSFLVFPFINHQFTDTVFLAGFFRRFSSLGKINKAVHAYIAAYYQWKQKRYPPPESAIHFDFMNFQPLQQAESCFYKVGLTAREILQELDKQTLIQKEFATWIMAHIDSVVMEQPDLLDNTDYLAGIDIENRQFEPVLMRQQAAASSNASTNWTFDSRLLHRVFHSHSE